MRPPIPYFGGKSTLAPVIAGLMPAHGHYVEPYGGSFAVLLAKEAAILEGFDVIGIEREAVYLPLIRARVERAHRRLQPGVAALAGVKLRPEIDGQDDLLALLSEVTS